MKNTFFTIVVPVYNTNKEYLKDCFSSIDKQTYTNYEVIIIDDGSNEETKQYLYKHRNKYKIIHQDTNKGIVVGRKTGVANAKGDYIVFLDSDDILNDKALENLNNIINIDDYDVIMSETPKFTDDISESKPLDSFFLPEGEVTKEDVLKQLLSLHINSIADKCAKKELLDFSKDNLDDSIINGEDLQQSTALILKSKKFYYTHKELSYYRINISGRTYYDISRLNDINFMVPPYRMVFENNSSYNNLLPVYKQACVNSLIYNIFRIYEDIEDAKQRNELLNRLNNLEITNIITNIKEKTSFPSEFVFSLLRNRHYLILSILAKIYPLQH